jgi:salicylate hydroxylase
METVKDDLCCTSRRAIRPLNVLIAGAGITGLVTGLALAQTGHAVTIIERASEITEVGAGLQVAPNASRILYRLGLLEEVMRYASVLTSISVR